MSKAFDPKEPVQMCDGRPARIICTDLKGPYPLGVAIEDAIGVEGIYRFNADGDSISGWPRLINIPKQHTGWVNVYVGGVSTGWHVMPYGTKEDADAATLPGRVACLYLEFTEGEGLDEEG